MDERTTSTYQIHSERMRLLLYACGLIRGAFLRPFASHVSMPYLQDLINPSVSSSSLLHLLSEDSDAFDAFERESDSAGHNVWHYIAVSGRVDFVNSAVARNRDSWDLGDMLDGMSCIHLALLDRHMTAMFPFFFQRPELQKKTLTLAPLPLFPHNPKAKPETKASLARRMRPLRLNLFQLAVFANKPLSFFFDPVSGFMSQEAWSMEDMGSVFHLAIWADCAHQLSKLLQVKSFLPFLLACKGPCGMRVLEFAAMWNREKCVRVLLREAVFSQQDVEAAKKIAVMYGSIDTLHIL